jgi:transcription elongation factor Elf1
MITNLNKADCGGCGNDKFEVYYLDNNDKSIVLECTECKSTTEITVSEPKLKVNFYNDSMARVILPTMR